MPFKNCIFYLLLPHEDAFDFCKFTFYLTTLLKFNFLLLGLFFFGLCCYPIKLSTYNDIHVPCFLVFSFLNVFALARMSNREWK